MIAGAASPKETTEALIADGLCFAYGRRAVLRQASVRVPPGRVTMLLGANGSGKSTLMRCLLGMLRPSQGRVRIGVEDVIRLPPRRRARHLAYVPQSSLLAESGLRVYEAIDSGRGPRAARGARAREEILDLLDRLHLTDRALDFVAELSGGERQRALIGRALAQRAPYLLLDEPVSALDLRHQVEILDLLRDLSRREGRGVLAIVHDVNLAARYADAVVVMLGGRAVAAGTPREALTVEFLERVYQTPLAVHHLEGRPVVLPRDDFRPPSPGIDLDEPGIVPR